MIFCSVAGGNHLALAKVLAQSVKDHAKDSKFVLCLLEEEIHPDALSFGGFDLVLRAKDLDVPDFYRFAAKYSLYEAACALKPYLLKYALQHYRKEKKFVYLDSDIAVYSSFNLLDALLDEQSIVLTPHRLEPQDHLNSIDEEIINLRDGVYQAAFVGIRRTKEAERFVNWWAERNYDYSITDPHNGLFLDQKWLDLAPCFFEGVYILRDPGYNMASWNLSQRRLTLNPTGRYIVNRAHLLVFFHYSGMGKWLSHSLQLHAPDPADAVHKLMSSYEKAYMAMGYEDYIHIPWSYRDLDEDERLIRRIVHNETV